MKLILLLFFAACLSMALSLNAQSTFNLSGYVSNTVGSPIGGVIVNASTATTNFQTATTTNGYFSFAVGSGNWDVSVDCTGLGSNDCLCAVDQLVSVTNDVSLNFVALAADFYIAGELRDSSNNPIPFVYVYGSTFLNGAYDTSQAITDLGGQFTMPVVNGYWDITINCADLSSSGCLCIDDQWTTISNEDASLVFIAPDAPFQITGRVADAAGNGITNIVVFADGIIAGNDYILESQTDNNGDFIFNVSTGGWSLLLDPNELNLLGYENPATQSVIISNQDAVITFVVQDCGPPQILTTCLPLGHIGFDYYVTLQTTNCGLNGVWSLASNSPPLPTGLILDSSGDLFGTPCNAGKFNILVALTDQGVESNLTSIQPLTLTVDQIIPSLSAPTFGNNGQFQTTITGALGEDYTVMFSSNLLTWTPLVITNLGTNGMLTLSFPMSSNNEGFFRAYESGININRSTVSFAAPIFYANVADSVATITVLRTNDLTTTVSVNYSTAGGTALQGCDYQPASGTLVFPANVTSNSFSVPISLSCSANQSETVGLKLTSSNGAALLPALLVIERPKPILSVFPNPLTLMEPENCPQTLFVSNSGPQGSLLNYSVLNNGALGGLLSLNGGYLVTGFLSAGQSASINISLMDEFTNDSSGLSGAVTGVYVYAPDAANFVKYGVSVNILSDVALVQKFVGTWSGTWSGNSIIPINGSTWPTAPTSGNWVLNLQQLNFGNDLQGVVKVGSEGGFEWSGTQEGWLYQYDSHGNLVGGTFFPVGIDLVAPLGVDIQPPASDVVFSGQISYCATLSGLDLGYTSGYDYGAIGTCFSFPGSTTCNEEFYLWNIDLQLNLDNTATVSVTALDENGPGVSFASGSGFHVSP